MSGKMRLTVIWNCQDKAQKISIDQLFILLNEKQAAVKQLCGFFSLSFDSDSILIRPPANRVNVGQIPSGVRVE